MNLWSEQRECIDEGLQQWMRQLQPSASEGLIELHKSLEYSLLRGGKRFRPLLSLLVGESFAVSPKRLLPWALAVEMIHNYSLIHDDLPCMDDDDLRRGEPTNHRVFGESTALLAGDTLLTEAFGMIARGYSDQPLLVSQLVLLLCEAAGFRGMVGGQAIDLKSKVQSLNLEELVQMHEMKTGALIRVSCEGAAIVCGLPLAKQQLAREFGALLGFAFQLKDDLLDSADEVEVGSFPGHLGLEQTKNKLAEVSSKAEALLSELNLSQGPLKDLIRMNLERSE